MRLIMGLMHVLACGQHAASSPLLPGFEGLKDVKPGLRMAGGAKGTEWEKSTKRIDIIHGLPNEFGIGSSASSHLLANPAQTITAASGEPLNPSQLKILYDPQTPYENKIMMLAPASASVSYACRFYNEAVQLGKKEESTGYLLNMQRWKRILEDKAAEFKITPNLDVNQYRVASSALSYLREISTVKNLPPNYFQEVQHVLHESETAYQAAEQMATKQGLNKDFQPLDTSKKPLQPAPGVYDHGVLPSHLWYPAKGGHPRGPFAYPGTGTDYVEEIFGTLTEAEKTQHFEAARTVVLHNTHNLNNVDGLAPVLNQVIEKLPNASPVKGFFSTQVELLASTRADKLPDLVERTLSPTYEQKSGFAYEYLLYDALIIAKAEEQAEYLNVLEKVMVNLKDQVLPMLKDDKSSSILVKLFLKRGEQLKTGETS